MPDSPAHAISLPLMATSRAKPATTIAFPPGERKAQFSTASPRTPSADTTPPLWTA